MDKDNREIFSFVDGQQVTKPVFPETTKKSRRSVFLSIPTSQAQSAWFFTPSKNASNSASRSKRNSKHRTTVSFDACQALVGIQSPSRPVSSSGSLPTDAPYRRSMLSLVKEGEPSAPRHRSSKSNIQSTLIQSYLSSNQPSDDEAMNGAGDHDAGGYPGYSPSVSSGGDQTTLAGGKKDKGKDPHGKWLSQFKSWISTSEPSAQAMKQHKKDVFKRAGLDANDALPHQKLHAPIGTLPADAIKPTTGPTPEKLLKKREEQRKKLRQSYLTSGRDLSQGPSHDRTPSTSSFTQEQWN